MSSLALKIYSSGSNEVVRERFPGIIGVHGASQAVTQDLKRHKKFVNHSKQIGFFLVPNPDFAGWDDKTRDEITAGGQYDFIEVAKEYAQMPPLDRLLSEEYTEPQDGVLFFIGGSVLELCDTVCEDWQKSNYGKVRPLGERFQIQPGTLEDFEHVPELVLPKAPRLSDIKIILPVAID